MDDENILEFQVIDTGIGIKPDIIDKLQEPFVTFNSSNLNKSGIGLGLNNCKNIIKLIGP